MCEIGPCLSVLDRVHEWIPEIVDGVEYLHSQGVVHGDLRGHNILVGHDSHILILDFGLVVFQIEDPGHSGTFGSLRGGNAHIYSFACLLVELYDIDGLFSNRWTPVVVTNAVLTGPASAKPP
ncbi:hypothetical protein EIP91_006374 [Steccherinum ochraceum]|uniref:Protein kinase domain-containing protein n=1 Tax=Steccherinum ochraceum TaxID=92696 RepID=A0A4R0RGK2_9APHY|nr:hypothetical protein EIP91_006374 [Steccherinum ochraceum]